MKPEGPGRSRIRALVTKRDFGGIRDPALLGIAQIGQATLGARADRCVRRVGQIFFRVTDLLVEIGDVDFLDRHRVLGEQRETFRVDVGETALDEDAAFGAARSVACTTPGFSVVIIGA